MPDVGDITTVLEILDELGIGKGGKADNPDDIKAKAKEVAKEYDTKVNLEPWYKAVKAMLKYVYIVDNIGDEFNLDYDKLQDIILETVTTEDNDAMQYILEKYRNSAGIFGCSILPDKMEDLTTDEKDFIKSYLTTLESSGAESVMTEKLKNSIGIDPNTYSYYISRFADKVKPKTFTDRVSDTVKTVVDTVGKVVDTAVKAHDAYTKIDGVLNPKSDTPKED